ncbi:unnamed protein product [Adineta ricciae]|uniref:Uncharacterized protein n=1 Tax=Adineta ricciae TaxID=249248 RepID=A0A815WUR9_ADIRI|nr:unnamed protein product [Adineta ricciae]CAF1600309.1 unnamed protein product [Adineta ricciae]
MNLSDVFQLFPFMKKRQNFLISSGRILTGSHTVLSDAILPNSSQGTIKLSFNSDQPTSPDTAYKASYKNRRLPHTGSSQTLLFSITGSSEKASTNTSAKIRYFPASTPSEASRSDRTRRLGTLTTGSAPFITTSDEIHNNKPPLPLATTQETKQLYRTKPFKPSRNKTIRTIHLISHIRTIFPYDPAQHCTKILRSTSNIFHTYKSYLAGKYFEVLPTYSIRTSLI